MNRDIEALIAQMTLEEKAGLCSGRDFWHLKGIERLGIPSIMVTDGPHGLRKQKGSSDHLGIMDSVPATCFPSAAGLASSWDRDLIRQVGAALGEECQAEEVAILLGPGANIKRSPLCGRNFEYFSEDPYLSSEMAASHIQGVQSQGVGTSLKHFAANNQEHRRMSVDAVVDERTLREIYLASFEGAVKKGRPWTVMSAYNKVNGTYASENRRLLTDILKEEWGHEGFVVSDWGAVDLRDQALSAGLELEMPSSGGNGEQRIIDAVRDGRLSEESLDNAVARILRIIRMSVDRKKTNAAYDPDAHHRFARKAASESMVLLKNDRGLLPLRRGSKIAVIGEFAKTPRYQGGGSSHIVPTRLDEPLSEIGKLGGNSTSVRYAQGYRLDEDRSDGNLLQEALQTAEWADIAVVFAGLPDRYESEGYDRAHLSLPANQNELIEALIGRQRNVAVVLMNGSAVEMPWADRVPAILEAYLGGQAAGGAIADLLFGDANPCGKLAETFPRKLSDNPSYLVFPGERDRAEYREGIFVGYRYYDTKQVKPLFPFGHGLSYTQFRYSDLTVDRKEMLDTDVLHATFKVTNTGTRAGKETVQVYVADRESAVIRPAKELKQFAKVDLQPGEQRVVSFRLDKRAFAYYNADIGDWHVESGEFDILVGSSSVNILLRDTVYVLSTVTLPTTVHRNTLVGDVMQDPAKAPLIQGLLQKFQEGMGASASDGSRGEEMMAAIVKYLPLRSLVSFSRGAFTNEMLEGLLNALNDSGRQSKG
ncbi:glycoside hydrolase family 3 C-terminal domain-containing protein [Paenibacillaceae bacterium WGS1546]|uniref:glycoside hydrolase family 3 C-terminal domain-containing protein n=1 Tax=Cohnella sp. WGS1546 TaxID=3366810 RepID=UPI00372D242E